jgi:eukaryotic-like serine/threonine-protein kinase
MASVPPLSLEPGYRLDRYELLCKIGQGGMASVWLARTQGKHGFERLVAIKTVLPEHAMDREFRTMLVDEARIVSAIDHPNVARILDVGEDRDIPFLVLEYVAGDALSYLHRKLLSTDRRIPAPIILRVLADTCAGLHFAHELVDADGKPLGIVHRDVSPQNIIVNELGVAKLIDFGVAKATGRLSAETATGIIKGKVAYMAPEQALGAGVDRRADIWAIGAIAYLLLAGKPPFDGANDAVRVIRTVSGDPPDPLPASVPVPVRDVILKSLSRDARDRYATAAELKRAIEAAAVASGLTATTEDVAKFCAEHVPESVKSRKKMLDRALAAAADRARARDVLAFVPGATGSSPSVAAVLRDSISEEETSVGTSARGVSVVEATPRPQRRWLPGALGAAVLFLVAGAFAIGTRSAHAPDEGKPGAATAPPSESAPAAQITANTAAPSASSSASAASAASVIATASSGKPAASATTKPATTTSTTSTTTVKPPRTPTHPGDKPPDDTIF